MLDPVGLSGIQYKINSYYEGIIGISIVEHNKGMSMEKEGGAQRFDIWWDGWRFVLTLSHPH